MANNKLVHMAHLLQELTQHFNDVNRSLSRAWLMHEMMRDNLVHLTIACREIVLQEKQDRSQDH